jgi:hypothetical protein
MIAAAAAYALSAKLFPIVAASPREAMTKLYMVLWSGIPLSGRPQSAGRQGMALAQQYPEAYDGIVASALAINWPQFSMGGYWASFVMNQLVNNLRSGSRDPQQRSSVTAVDLGSD